MKKLKDYLNGWLLGGLIAGALGGYLYYHFFGCYNGCRITGNPVNMTLYGSLVGAVLFFRKSKAGGDT